MRWIIFVFAAALLFGGATRAQVPDRRGPDRRGPDRRGPDRPGAGKRIEGRWLVAHRYFTPSPATAVVAKLLTDLGNEVEIKDRKLLSTDPKVNLSFVLDVDPSKSPKAVDLKLKGDKTKVLLGIYKLDGDILSLVVGAGEKRPQTFLNSAENQVQLVLKKKASGSDGLSAP